MGRGLTLLERLDALTEVIDQLGDDLPEVSRGRARVTLDIVRERAVLDPDTVLVALLGATGSGKSALFNALAGADIARSGVVRPTTSQPLAATVPGRDATALLDWLGVPERVSFGTGALLPNDVVLLDLPDIDSYSQENRATARRLADRVDMLIWVVDPQKYADDVIHSQWIAPMAGAAKATVMVLNQADRLDDAGRRAITAHLGELLERETPVTIPVLAVSALTGEGVAPLGDVVDSVARMVRADNIRAVSNLERVSHEIGDELELPASLDSLDEVGFLDAFTDEVAASAGFDRIADEAAASYRHRAHKAAGWVPLRWISALRVDPLGRRHLGRGAQTSNHAGVSVQTIEPLGAAEAARINTALRRAVDVMTEDRPPVFQRALRRKTKQAMTGLPDAVDHAIMRTPMIRATKPAWWGWMSALQWIGWVAVIVGAGWLAARWAAEEYLLVPLPLPYLRALPIPTWCLIVGLAVTILSALIVAIGSRIGASRTRRRAYRGMRAALEQDLRVAVLVPLVDEDARQRRVVDMLASV